MSWTTGRMLGFDLESTDKSPTDALPVSFALVYYDKGEMQRSRHGLIDPGVPIPPETTEIHGITNEMVKARGGDLVRSINGIVGALVEAATESVPIVGMNLAYDLTLIDRSYRRLHEDVSIVENRWDGRVIDALVLDRHVDKYRKGPRRLVNLCEHYGVELTDAHSALADAVAAVEVVVKIAERYPEEVGDVDVDVLYGNQQTWHREYINHLSEYYVGQGKEPLDESEGDFPIRGMRKVTI